MKTRNLRRAKLTKSRLPAGTIDQRINGVAEAAANEAFRRRAAAAMRGQKMYFRYKPGKHFWFYIDEKPLSSGFRKATPEPVDPRMATTQTVAWMRKKARGLPIE